MNLFSPDYILTLTPDEWQIAMRPITGDGGAQRLLRDLHDSAVLGLTTKRMPITVGEDVLDKCYVYAYDYGSGGFQDRFRAIVKAALRAGWQPS